MSVMTGPAKCRNIPLVNSDKFYLQMFVVEAEMNAEAAHIQAVSRRLYEQDTVATGNIGGQLAQDLEKGLALRTAGVGPLHHLQGLRSNDDFSARCRHRLDRRSVACLLMTLRLGSLGSAVRRTLAM